MNKSYPIAALLLASLTTAQVGRYRDEVFPQTSVQRDVAYGQAVNSSTRQQETLLLDLYEPVGDSAQRRPVIVLAHGGGFVVGSKSDPDYVQIAEAFARRGYVAASIDYRLARPPLQQNLPQTIIDGRSQGHGRPFRPARALAPRTSPRSLAESTDSAAFRGFDLDTSSRTGSERVP